MKKTFLLVTLVAVLAVSASAQTYIDFHQMPIVNTPAPLPDNYPSGSGLVWDHFYYVTPGLWKDAGPGFWIDPASHHNTVAFVGGTHCYLPAACFGSIKLQQPIGKSLALPAFKPVSVSLSAGWLPNKVTVTGYDNSKVVGTVDWQLTTKPQTFSFPAAWRVTQLVFTSEFIPSSTNHPQAGSMVVYSLILMKD